MNYRGGEEGRKGGRDLYPIVYLYQKKQASQIIPSLNEVSV